MGLFSWLFGKPLTPTQIVRKNQRAITKAIRNIERERMSMEQQEKKMIIEIKKTAKSGQMDTVKIIAIDLVKTRRYIKKFMLMKANLQTVSSKMLTLQSQQAIGEAMIGVTVALRGMNMQLRLPQVQRILKEFEKQSEIMDLKESMMNESVEDAIGEEDQEIESDELVMQILDELGLQLQDQLPELPGPRKPQTDRKIHAFVSTANGNEIDDDLQTRLNNLRKN